MFVKVAFLLVGFAYLHEVSSHGRMMDPPNRASLFRFLPDQPANYNDAQFFCGGRQVQHSTNGGKCGTCGDNFADPVPRSNENTGTYGNGIVTREYESGSVIDVEIEVTANHVGTFSYSLCVLQDPNLPEQEECFEDLPLEDGSSVYQVQSKDYWVHNRVRLPEGLTCDRCVLRWHYTTGNSWGTCQDGRSGMGCGPQETFRSCADVRIL